MNIKFERVFKGNVNTLHGDTMQYPETEKPQIERWLVTLPPKTCGEWHIHLVPEFFHVDCGTLYVVNELPDKTLKITTYHEGEHGLTDCHVPQFIWNPDKTSTVRVAAIYIGSQDINPTRKIGGRPSDELLDELLSQPEFQENLTELYNQKNNHSEYND